MSLDHDPARLLVANHQIAHAVAFHIAGIHIHTIHVRGHGATTTGHVHVPDPDLDDPAALRRFLAALRAGAEGTQRWTSEHGRMHRETFSTDDIATIRKLRRTPTGRRIPRGVITSDARRIIHTHWGAITRLTPRLAHRGSLPTSELPRRVA